MPRDVPVVAVEEIHDAVGTRTTVVDVAEDMELVDSETLDDIGDRHDEVVGTPCRDDGVDDHVHVVGFVLVLRALMKELLDDIREVLRQRLAYLRTCVFARDVAAYGYEVMERDVVPVVDVGLRGLDKLKFLLRIIDERAELALLRVAQCVAEELIDLSLDVSRCVLEDMLEGLIFSVKVGNEMLRGLREVEDGGEVDDLRTGCCYGGE